MDPHLSNHKVIHTKLSLVRPRPQRKKKNNIVNFEVLTPRLCEMMSSALFTSPACNVEDLRSQYDHEFLTVTSRLSAPWYTEDIGIEKCKRRQIERLWRKSGLEADKQQFTDQCKQVGELIKSIKVNHYSSLIIENKSDHKVLFHSINRLLHRMHELCNKFADFFSEKIFKIQH